VTVESCGKRLSFFVFKSGVLNSGSFWAWYISVHNELTVGTCVHLLIYLTDFNYSFKIVVLIVVK
jgi:hypothetical protein